MSPEETDSKAATMDGEASEGEKNLSLEEINELLAQEDPRFVEGLEELRDIKSPSEDSLKSLEIEADQGEVGEKPKGLMGKFFAPLSRMVRAIGRAVLAPVIFLKTLNYMKAVGHSKALVLRVAKGSVQGIKSFLKKIAHTKTRVKKWYASQTPVAKRTLFLMVTTVFLMAALGSLFGRVDLKSWFGEVEVVNLADHADRVFSFSEEEPRESFFSPLRRPQAYILMEDQIVHLKASGGRGQHRLFVEYIIEASSQRAAQEIQSREVEVRDHLARVIETFSRDELLSVDGKNRLRENMVSRVNSLLQLGYVRELQFQQFLIR